MEQYEIYEPAQAQKDAAGKAVRSLVFGILSVALSGVFAIVFGILARVQGNGAVRIAEQNGLPRDDRATAGRILGLIGLIIGILALVWGVIRLVMILTGLTASIASGSLGVFEEYFRDLGEQLNSVLN